MQTHGPKRVYTPRSVEFWFEKLSNEWEGAFSTRQLDEGARIYRQGEVRELELTDKDAIVHRRVEKRDEYAVIEWGRDGLSVRSSSTDLDVARALAVAGLHEIEELVADEVSPLPGTALGESSPQSSSEPPEGAASSPEVSAASPVPVPSSHAANPSNGSGAIGTGLARSSTGVASATRSPAVSGGTPARVGGVVNGGPSRPLVLTFQTKVEGLVFQAFWKNSGGEAVIERAIKEGISIVIEGVHIVPGFIREDLVSLSNVKMFVLTLQDEEVHRGRFYSRCRQMWARRPLKRYMDSFDDIRRTHLYFESQAKKFHIPVIENIDVTTTIDSIIENITQTYGSEEDVKGTEG